MAYACECELEHALLDFTLSANNNVQLGLIIWPDHTLQSGSARGRQRATSAQAPLNVQYFTDHTSRLQNEQSYFMRQRYLWISIGNNRLDSYINATETRNIATDGNLGLAP